MEANILSRVPQAIGAGGPVTGPGARMAYAQATGQMGVMGGGSMHVSESSRRVWLR